MLSDVLIGNALEHPFRAVYDQQIGIGLPFVTVRDSKYNATGDGVADDWNAIQTAMNDMSALGGGVVMTGIGKFKCLQQLLQPKGVVLQGVYNYGRNVGFNAPSVIYGVHTGAAILSLKGAQGCSVRDLELYGDQTTTPKTGLLLGRTSAASAGKHFIQNVLVDGYFSKAAVYSIASEENTWINNTFILNGGGAINAYYTAQGDGLAVDGLTGSSNVGVWHYGTEIFNFVDDVAAACIYEGVGSSTRAHIWFGGYLIMVNGICVNIVDSQDLSGCPGPLAFYGMTGEISGTGPSYGFSIGGTVGHVLRRLIIDGCLFDTRVGGDFAAHSGVSFSDSRLWIGNQNHVSVFDTTKITNSVIHADIDSTGVKTYTIGEQMVVDGSAAGGVTFGAGNPRLRYQSATGHVQLVNNSAAAFETLELLKIMLSGAQTISGGAGSPNGSLAGTAGDYFFRTDTPGSANQRIYVCTGGNAWTGIV